MPQEEREKIKEKHEKHLQNKMKARQLMEMDKAEAEKNCSLSTINFDLQKVLTTPRAPIGTLYYMSKLCVWNFTVYDMARHEGFCYVWNETIGCRGANEIASFLWDFMKTRVSQGSKEFLIYSDNCGGQNRNKIVFSMYIEAALELGIVITHRFLEVGHTQCDGDSVHAMIEKKAKNTSVFTQSQWCRVMETAKVTKPYKVKEITQDEIFNYADFSDLFNWVPVKIASVKEISIRPNESLVNVKYDLSQRVKIFKQNRSFDDVQQFTLERAYNEKLVLSGRKSKDLESMLTKNLIPVECRDFYENILQD